MDKYLNLFREMISLRGLSDHTLNSYCTYIRSYLNYLEQILCKSSEDISWDEQKTSNAIINCKSGALGYHLSQCTECGYKIILANSWRNRNRPNCQAVTMTF